LRHLKKQPIAILLALLIVAGAVFIGVNRSVGEQVAAVREQFYSGVADPAGGTRPGIQGQLTLRTTAALRMLSIGESYADSNELAGARADLQAARQELLRLLTVGAGASVLFDADQAMGFAASRYFAVLHPIVMAAEGEEITALEASYDTMQSAARTIQDSGYNEAVGAFHRTVMGEFPMTALRPIVFVRMPELFA